MTFAFIDLKKQYQELAAEIQTGLTRVMENASFINGSEVGELEKALADYAGVSSVVSCGNGTSSMEMILMAKGIGAGDAVFCPSFTFIATAEVIALRGARPIFVDIDPRTYNIDPVDFQAKIKTVESEGKLTPKGVIPVDLFGLPADYEALEPIAAEHGLFILEDAAQGFGGRLGQRRAGSFGQAASTSFFPAKPLGCYGDGGAVLTNDDELAAIIRSIRTHGAGGHKYEHVRLGGNSRLDTMQAAILQIKLKAFPRELEERQRVANGYSSRLREAMNVPFIPDGYLSSWAQYTTRVPAKKREVIMSRLKDKGVPTAIYYPKPLHLQPAFAYLGGKPGDLPISEKASMEVVSLPMHPYLSDDDVAAISGLVIEALS
jgi:dTDP-4-amino-4,6-dideoxygalactose transaminase